MDPELKQALADLEARLSQRFEVESKQLETRLSQRFEVESKQLETRLSQRFEAKLEDLNRHFEERLEATETKLLTAFHDWAVTYEVRARGTSAAVRDLDERLGHIEERVAKLERGRNGSTDKR